MARPSSRGAEVEAAARSHWSGDSPRCRDSVGATGQRIPGWWWVRHLAGRIALVSAFALALVWINASDEPGRTPVWGVLVGLLLIMLTTQTIRDFAIGRKGSVGFVESISYWDPKTGAWIRWLTYIFRRGTEPDFYLSLFDSELPSSDGPFGAARVPRRIAKRHREGTAWAVLGDCTPGSWVILLGEHDIVWSTKVVENLPEKAELL